MKLEELLIRWKEKVSSTLSSFIKKEGEEGSVDPKTIHRRQVVILSGILLSVCMFIYLFLHIGSKPGHKKNIKEPQEQKKIRIEVSKEGVDPNKMWTNYLEEKILELQDGTKMEIGKISESVETRSEENLSESRKEINALRKELNDTKALIEDSLNDIKMSINKKGNDSDQDFLHDIALESMVLDGEEDVYIAPPKDNKIYIPANSYLPGVLTTGISVSTAIGSRSEPIPITIYVTGRGSLPKNFNVDLSTCKVGGSTYGDLSSERAMIRIETMTCENRETGEIIETDVIGTAYGDDGMNDIKGRVVDMSSKHIKNAAVGSLLSGLAGTMKSTGDFRIDSLGGVRTKDPGFGSKLKDNMLGGVGNSADKLADYFISKAENMSPVLQIPGGTRVDILFTKGVYLGSRGVREKIAKVRKEKKDE